MLRLVDEAMYSFRPGAVAKQPLRSPEDALENWGTHELAKNTCFITIDFFLLPCFEALQGFSNARELENLPPRFERRA